MTDEQLRRWALSWGVFLPRNVRENLAVELVKLAQIIRDDTAEQARNAALDEAAQAAYDVSAEIRGHIERYPTAPSSFANSGYIGGSIDACKAIRALKDK